MTEGTPAPPVGAAEDIAASTQSPSSERFAALRSGALLSFCAHLALIATIAPGRYALAERQGHLGRDRWSAFFSGLAHDTADTSLLMGLFVALPLLFPESLRKERGWARLLFVLVPLACIVAGGSSSCFGEFAIQRGTFPTWFDLMGGVKDTSFITSALQVFLYGRHARPIASGVALATLFLVAWSRATDVARRRDANAVVAGCIAMSTLVMVGSNLPNFPRYGWFPKLGDGDVAGAPFRTFLHPMTVGDTNVRYGVLGIVERAELPAELDDVGAATLGFPKPKGLDGAACTLHPFRRPLPMDDTRAPELVKAFDDLSRVLFDTDRPPRRLVQFLLESYRADDLHALHPAAAETLAPHTNKLIEDALARRSFDLTIPHLFQAGCRSSQGFTANMCGLGMVGFNISASRDLGALPVRCLPDVLVDAGVDAHFVYGAEISFDGVDDFLRLHGVTDVHGETEFSKDLPRGGWGISDLAMLDQLFRLMESSPKTAFSWWTMPTLSNHTPFWPPSDMPEEAKKNVEDATRGRTLTTEMRGRLGTFAYTDAVLARAIERVDASPEAAETLVFANADHSTADDWSWEDDPARLLRAKAQIPFLLHVPEAMVRAHRHPDALRDALTAAQRALSAAPVSQNDLPTLALTLLGHSDLLKKLPAERRWHTMGGQRTSPDFRLDARPGAALCGLNSIGEFFAVDASGNALGPHAPVETLATPDDVHKDHSEVLPSAALFGHFLRKWARSCPAPESIRPGTGP